MARWEGILSDISGTGSMKGRLGLRLRGVQEDHAQQELEGGRPKGLRLGVYQENHFLGKDPIIFKKGCWGTTISFLAV